MQLRAQLCALAVVSACAVRFLQEMSAWLLFSEVSPFQRRSPSPEPLVFPQLALAQASAAAAIGEPVSFRGRCENETCGTTFCPLGFGPIEEGLEQAHRDEMAGKSFCMECIRYYSEHRTLNKELVASRADTGSPANHEDEGGRGQKVTHPRREILSWPGFFVACRHGSHGCRVGKNGGLLNLVWYGLYRACAGPRV